MFHSFDAQASTLQEFANALFVVFYERLLKEHTLAEEIAKPALNHFMNDIFWLPFLLCSLCQNLTFFSTTA